MCGSVFGFRPESRNSIDRSTLINSMTSRTDLRRRTLLEFILLWIALGFGMVAFGMVFQNGHPERFLAWRL